MLLDPKGYRETESHSLRHNQISNLRAIKLVLLLFFGGEFRFRFAAFRPVLLNTPGGCSPRGSGHRSGALGRLIEGPTQGAAAFG
jgi:hypothetical protein